MENVSLCTELGGGSMTERPVGCTQGLHSSAPARPIAPDADHEPHPGASPLSPANHNHLRLTRILTKLRILGCENQAEALSDALDLVYRQHPTLVGEHTDGYWCSMMTLGAGQG